MASSAAPNLVWVHGDAYPVSLKVATEFAQYAPDASAVALIEVQGKLPRVAAAARGRITTEVVYVIDTSDSMLHAMPCVNAALQFVCQSTPEHHSVAIVTFAQEAEVYWSRRTMTADAKQQLKHRAPLDCMGYTNLSQGLYQGLEQFSDPAAERAVQRVLVLLSDGMATHGPKTAEAILEVCRQHPCFAHVHVMAMALGSQIDRELLGTLAVQTHGRMYHIQSVDDLPMAFGDCLGTLLTLSATRMAIEVEAEQEADALRQATSRYNTEGAPTASSCALQSRSTLDATPISQRQIEFIVGSIYEGELRSVLVEFPSTVQWFVVRVRFTDSSTGVPTTLERRCRVPRTSATPAGQQRRHPDVAVQLLRADGQRIINACARTASDEGLEPLKQRIHDEHLEQHPVGVGLLSDIQRLQKLFQDLATGGGEPARAAYLTECTSTSVGLSTQAASRDAPCELRRHLSDQCTQQCSLLPSAEPL